MFLDPASPTAFRFKAPPLIALLLLCSLHAFGADWPMWRADAARRGTSTAELPDKLYLQWTLELAKPDTAWPANQEKLQFDRLYEPVLAGKRLFVPSMISDKLTAFDTDSGKELWRFYTDGPVRFAPAIWKNKIFIACDDGYLYCLSTADGSLVWKFRGGPSERRVLGNDRLISTWPARGGPVIYDDKIYFGAGIWPFMGIFLHALDAETGRLIWTNSGEGSSFQTQQHGSPAFSGIAPQGYLAANENFLVVSGGRTMPAVYDRKTGAIKHYDVSARNMGTKGGGGYDVVLGENFYLNRECAYRLDNGKFITKLEALLINDHSIICHDGEGLRGFQPRWEKHTAKDRKGKVQSSIRIRKTWAAPIDQKVKKVFIQAGKHLYCSGEGGRILAVDFSNIIAGAKVVWSIEIPDEALNMIAGDEKLFVSTAAGRIYCFGGAKTELQLPVKKKEPAAEKVEIKSIVSKGSTWKYQDDGQGPGADWQSISFDDSKWKEGPARLGYGENNEKTRLGFGKNDKKKHAACYFRHAFELPDGLQFGDLELQILADDSAIIYLNGKQAARLRMPEGETNHQTYSGIQIKNENTFDKLKLPGNLLQPGKNLLAVAVHQQRADSSDLTFDLNLAPLTSPKRIFQPGITVEEAAPQKRWEGVATRILQGMKTRNGYCLALGLGSGQLVSALAEQSELHIVVIEANGDKVAAARKRLDEKGLYGQRIAIIEGEPVELPLAPYMADLVVSEELTGLLEKPANSTRAVFKLLRPFTGMACLPAGNGSLKEAFASNKLHGCKIESSENLLIVRKTSAPAGSGSWSHQYGDVSHSVASAEMNVRAPLGLLWFGGPSNSGVLPRHGHGPIPQFIEGRIIIEGRDMLRAVDAYTGRLLWERTLKDIGIPYDNTDHQPGANILGSNYVSVADGIYAIYKKSCLKLDPDTGKTLSEFKINGSGEKPQPVGWGYLGIWEDYLIAGIQPTKLRYPDYSKAEIDGLKDDQVKNLLGRLANLKNFEVTARGKKENSKDHLGVNLNRLLVSGAIYQKIPPKVRAKAGTDELQKQLRKYLEAVPGRAASDAAAVRIKRTIFSKIFGLPEYKPKAAGKDGSWVGVGSKKIAVLDRKTGKIICEHEASYNIRHNTLAAGNGKLFFMDRLTDAQLNYFKRRGKVAQEARSIKALEMSTGKLLWKVQERVFGTWLGYSEEFDILLQAGSKARDRAGDEVGQGMVAYRGATGEKLWEHSEKYFGPPILLGQMVVTQADANAGHAYDLKTGKRIQKVHPFSGQPVNWSYTRNYGCNTAIGCPNMITFRSAAAGYYDLTSDSGTGNLGGFRSGCTANLIPAGGILNAPDYTRTCTCSYQNQASLAFVHMPEAEMWTFTTYKNDDKDISDLSLNFGAPGDRRAKDGAYWIDYPSVGGPSPDAKVKLSGKDLRYKRIHSSLLEAGELRWVASSLLEGEAEIIIPLRKKKARPLELENLVKGRSPVIASRAKLYGDSPGNAKDNPEPAGSLGQDGSKDAIDAKIEGYEELAPASISVELKVRVNSNIDYVDARESGKDKQHGFVFDNRKARVRYFVANEAGDNNEKEIRLEPGNELPKDKWTDIAFTYDAATGRGALYINGELAGEHQGPANRGLWWDNKKPKYAIAKGAKGGGNLIDELRVSNASLSPAQLLCKKDAAVPAENVAGHWNMRRPAEKISTDLYTVQLVFAEPEDIKAGRRVFDVELDGSARIEKLDIAGETGGPRRSIIKTIDDVTLGENLRLRLKARGELPPILSGLRVTRKLIK